jgi:DNA-binding protein Fis
MEVRTDVADRSLIGLCRFSFTPRGNKLAAARMPGIARATLYEKLGQMG